MIVKPDITAKTSLQFFGKVSASVSHEIKNVLAIGTNTKRAKKVLTRKTMNRLKTF